MILKIAIGIFRYVLKATSERMMNWFSSIAFDALSHEQHRRFSSYSCEIEDFKGVKTEQEECG